MDAEQARNLKANGDFNAFIDLLKQDVEMLKDDLVSVQARDEMYRLQEHIKCLQSIEKRLLDVIEEYD